MEQNMQQEDAVAQSAVEQDADARANIGTAANALASEASNAVINAAIEESAEDTVTADDASDTSNGVDDEAQDVSDQDDVQQEQDVDQQSAAQQETDQQQTAEKQEAEEPLAAPDLWRAAALHLCELSAFILMILGLQMRAWAWDWRFSVATAVASVIIYALCVVCVKRFFNVSKDAWSSYLQNLVIIVADALIGELWLHVSGSAAFFALLWALLIVIRWAMYWRTGGHPSSKHAYFGTM